MQLVLRLVLVNLNQLKLVLLVFLSLELKAGRGIQHVRHVTLDQLFQHFVSFFGQVIFMLVILDLNNFDCLQILLELLFE